MYVLHIFWPEEEVYHLFMKRYNITQATLLSFMYKVRTCETLGLEHYWLKCFWYFALLLFSPTTARWKIIYFSSYSQYSRNINLVPKYGVEIWVFTRDIRRTCAQDYCVQFWSRLLTPNNATVLQFWNVYHPIHELNLVFGIMYSTRLGKQG